jgi:hypothetical protein
MSSIVNEIPRWIVFVNVIVMSDFAIGAASLHNDTIFVCTFVDEHLPLLTSEQKEKEIR